MNEIVNKSLLAGDKFMPEMNLNQPGLTSSACKTFTKNKERLQTLKETEDIKYIYRNELDKVCYQHDMDYADFKNLAKRTASDKVLEDKAFNIDKNLGYNGYQRGLSSMVYKYLIKNPLCLQMNLLLVVVLLCFKMSN